MSGSGSRTVDCASAISSSASASTEGVADSGGPSPLDRSSSEDSSPSSTMNGSGTSGSTSTGGGLRARRISSLDSYPEVSMPSSGSALGSAASPRDAPASVPDAVYRLLEVSPGDGVDLAGDREYGTAAAAVIAEAGAIAEVEDTVVAVTAEVEDTMEGEAGRRSRISPSARVQIICSMQLIILKQKWHDKY